MEDKIAECGVLLSQLEIPLEISLHCLKLARKHGVFTILNTAPAPTKPLPNDIYQYIDILCANQPEIAMISNLPANSPEEAIKAAQMVIQLGVKEVLLTLGSDGCLLVRNDSSYLHVPSMKVEKVEDTTGAGDSFLGALAYFLAKGMNSISYVHFFLLKVLILYNSYNII